MNYVNVRELGKGSFGKVYLVEDKNKNRFAKKVVKCPISRKDKEYLIYELCCLKFHTCEYIIKLHDAFQEHNSMCMITEYASRGDLRKLITSKINVSFSYVAKWTLQVASALQYLHNSNLIHRDVKSENIFLFSDKSVKLGDLGTLRQGENVTSTYIGTPYYMTPEIEQGIVSPKTDVYALGIVLYELLHGKPPYNGANIRQLAYNKKTQHVNYHCPPDFQRIIQKMITRHMNRRIEIKEVLQSKELKKYYSHEYIPSATINLNLYKHLIKMSWRGITNVLFPSSKVEELPRIKPKPKEKEVPLPKYDHKYLALPPVIPLPKYDPQHLPLPLLKREHNRIFRSNIILG